MGALELKRGSEDFSGFGDPECAQGVDRGFFLVGAQEESGRVTTSRLLFFDARSLQTAGNHTCGSSVTS